MFEFLKKFLHSFLVLIISFSLIFTENSLMGVKDGFAQSSLLQARVTHSDIQILPPSISQLQLTGMQKGKSFQGSKPQTILLIRDLHCQEEAQLKIAQAIQYLYQAQGVTDVLMEGAEGPLRTRLYQSFPDEKIREKVAGEFLKQGYLSGAEFSALKMGREENLSLYGIEESGLYIENFKAFQNTRKAYQVSLPLINQFNQSIENLKQERYSKELKALDETFWNLQEGKTGIEQILETFKKTGLQLKGLEEWEEIIRLSQALDSKKIQESLGLLMADFQKRFVQEEMKEVIQWTLEYRVGKQKASEYLSRLREKAGEEYFDKTYPQIETWRKLSLFQETLDLESLMNEAQSSLKEHILKLAQEEKIKTIFELDQNWRRLDRLFKLELSREELEELKREAKDGSVDIFQKNILEQIKTLHLDVLSTDWQPLIKSAWRFYELAQKRDEVLAFHALKVIKNGITSLKLLPTTDDRRLTTAVLITGGFHTQAIQKKLEEEGISYTTWTPIVSGDIKQSPYEKIMMDERFDLDNVEFSEKRLAARNENDPIRQMLSAPNLLADWQRLGRVQQEKLEEFVSRMVQEDLKEGGSFMDVLEKWLAREDVEKLADSEKRLLRNIASLFERVFSINKLDPASHDQAVLAIGVAEEVFGRDSVFAGLMREYFQKRNKGQKFQQFSKVLAAAVLTMDFAELVSLVVTDSALYHPLIKAYLKENDLDEPQGREVFGEVLKNEATRRVIDITFTGEGRSALLGNMELFRTIAVRLIREFGLDIQKKEERHRLLKVASILAMKHVRTKRLKKTERDQNTRWVWAQAVMEWMKSQGLPLSSGPYSKRKCLLTVVYEVGRGKEKGYQRFLSTVKMIESRLALPLHELSSDQRQKVLTAACYIAQKKDRTPLFMQVLNDVFEKIPEGLALINVDQKLSLLAAAYQLALRGPIIIGLFNERLKQFDPTDDLSERIKAIRRIYHSLDAVLRPHREKRTKKSRKIVDAANVGALKSPGPHRGGGVAVEESIEIAWDLRLLIEFVERSGKAEQKVRMVDGERIEYNLVSLKDLDLNQSVDQEIKGLAYRLARELGSDDAFNFTVNGQHYVFVLEHTHNPALSEQHELSEIFVDLKCAGLKTLIEQGNANLPRKFTWVRVRHILAWAHGIRMAHNPFLFQSVRLRDSAYRDNPIQAQSLDALKGFLQRTINSLSFEDTLSMLVEDRNVHGGLAEGLLGRDASLLDEFNDEVMEMLQKRFAQHYQEGRAPSREKQLKIIQKRAMASAKKFGPGEPKKIERLAPGFFKQGYAILAQVSGHDTVHDAILYQVIYLETGRMNETKVTGGKIEFYAIPGPQTNVQSGVADSRNELSMSRPSDEKSWWEKLFSSWWGGANSGKKVGRLKDLSPADKGQGVSEKDAKKFIEYAQGRSETQKQQVLDQEISYQLVTYDDSENTKDPIGKLAKKKGLKNAFHIPAAQAQDVDTVFVSKKAFHEDPSKNQQAFYKWHEVSEIYIRERFGAQIKEAIQKGEIPKDFTLERVIHILAWALDVEMAMVQDSGIFGGGAQAYRGGQMGAGRSLVDLLKFIDVQIAQKPFEALPGLLNEDRREQLRIIHRFLPTAIEMNKQFQEGLRIRVAKRIAEFYQNGWEVTPPTHWRKAVAQVLKSSPDQNRAFQIQHLVNATLQTMTARGPEVKDELMGLYPELVKSGYAPVAHLGSTGALAYRVINLKTGDLEFDMRNPPGHGKRFPACHVVKKIPSQEQLTPLIYWLFRMPKAERARKLLSVLYQLSLRIELLGNKEGRKLRALEVRVDEEGNPFYDEDIPHPESFRTVFADLLYNEHPPESFQRLDLQKHIEAVFGETFGVIPPEGRLGDEGPSAISIKYIDLFENDDRPSSRLLPVQGEPVIDNVWADMGKPFFPLPPKDYKFPRYCALLRGMLLKIAPELPDEIDRRHFYVGEAIQRGNDRVEKGVLNLSYRIAEILIEPLNLVLLSLDKWTLSKDAVEDFVVPWIEEGVLILALLLGGPWIYIAFRIGFVIAHYFQDHAPPKGKKRTWFEKIFIPFVISSAAIAASLAAPLIISASLIPWAVLFTGLAVHMLANRIVTWKKLRYQKGVLGEEAQNTMHLFGWRGEVALSEKDRERVAGFLEGAEIPQPGPYRGDILLGVKLEEALKALSYAREQRVDSSHIQFKVLSRSFQDPWGNPIRGIPMTPGAYLPQDVVYMAVDVRTQDSGLSHWTVYITEEMLKYIQSHEKGAAILAALLAQVVSQSPKQNPFDELTKNLYLFWLDEMAEMASRAIAIMKEKPLTREAADARFALNQILRVIKEETRRWEGDYPLITEWGLDTFFKRSSKVSQEINGQLEGINGASQILEDLLDPKAAIREIANVRNITQYAVAVMSVFFRYGVLFQLLLTMMLSVLWPHGVFPGPTGLPGLQPPYDNVWSHIYELDGRVRIVRKEAPPLPRSGNVSEMKSFITQRVLPYLGLEVSDEGGLTGFAGFYSSSNDFAAPEAALARMLEELRGEPQWVRRVSSERVPESQDNSNTTEQRTEPTATEVTAYGRAWHNEEQLKIFIRTLLSHLNLELVSEADLNGFAPFYVQSAQETESARDALRRMIEELNRVALRPAHDSQWVRHAIYAGRNPTQGHHTQQVAEPTAQEYTEARSAGRDEVREQDRYEGELYRSASAEISALLDFLMREKPEIYRQMRRVEIDASRRTITFIKENGQVLATTPLTSSVQEMHLSVGDLLRQLGVTLNLEEATRLAGRFTNGAQYLFGLASLGEEVLRPGLQERVKHNLSKFTFNAPWLSLFALLTALNVYVAARRFGKSRRYKKDHIGQLLDQIKEVVKKGGKIVVLGEVLLEVKDGKLAAFLDPKKYRKLWKIVFGGKKNLEAFLRLLEGLNAKISKEAKGGEVSAPESRTAAIVTDAAPVKTEKAQTATAFVESQTAAQAQILVQAEPTRVRVVFEEPAMRVRVEIGGGGLEGAEEYIERAVGGQGQKHMAATADGRVVPKNAAEEGVDEEKDIHTALDANFRRGSVIAITDEDLNDLDDKKIDALSAETLIEIFAKNVNNIKSDRFNDQDAVRKYWRYLLIERGEGSQANLMHVRNYLKTLYASRGFAKESHRYVIPMGGEPVLDSVRVLGHAGQQNKTKKKGSNLTETKTVFINEKALIAGENHKNRLQALITHEKEDLKAGEHKWRGKEKESIDKLWKEAKQARSEINKESPSRMNRFLKTRSGKLSLAAAAVLGLLGIYRAVSNSNRAPEEPQSNEAVQQSSPPVTPESRKAEVLEAMRRTVARLEAQHSPYLRNARAFLEAFERNGRVFNTPEQPASGQGIERSGLALAVNYQTGETVANYDVASGSSVELMGQMIHEGRHVLDRQAPYMDEQRRLLSEMVVDGTNLDPIQVNESTGMSDVNEPLMRKYQRWIALQVEYEFRAYSEEREFVISQIGSPENYIRNHEAGYQSGAMSHEERRTYESVKVLVILWEGAIRPDGSVDELIVRENILYATIRFLYSFRVSTVFLYEKMQGHVNFRNTLFVESGISNLRSHLTVLHPDQYLHWLMEIPREFQTGRYGGFSPDMGPVSALHVERNRELAKQNRLKLTPRGGSEEVEIEIERYELMSAEGQVQRATKISNNLLQEIRETIHRAREPSSKIIDQIFQENPHLAKDKEELLAIIRRVPVLVVPGRVTLHEGGSFAHARRGVYARDRADGKSADEANLQESGIWLGEHSITELSQEDLVLLLLEEAQHILHPEAVHGKGDGEIDHSEKLLEQLKILTRKHKEPEADETKFCEADTKLNVQKFSIAAVFLGLFGLSQIWSRINKAPEEPGGSNQNVEVRPNPNPSNVIDLTEQIIVDRQLSPEDRVKNILRRAVIQLEDARSPHARNARAFLDAFERNGRVFNTPDHPVSGHQGIEREDVALGLSYQNGGMFANYRYMTGEIIQSLRHRMSLFELRARLIHEGTHVLSVDSEQTREMVGLKNEVDAAYNRNGSPIRLDALGRVISVDEVIIEKYKRWIALLVEYEYRAHLLEYDYVVSQVGPIESYIQRNSQRYNQRRMNEQEESIYEYVMNIKRFFEGAIQEDGRINERKLKENLFYTVAYGMNPNPVRDILTHEVLSGNISITNSGGMVRQGWVDRSYIRVIRFDRYLDWLMEIPREFRNDQDRGSSPDLGPVSAAHLERDLRLAGVGEKRVLEPGHIGKPKVKDIAVIKNTVAVGVTAIKARVSFKSLVQEYPVVGELNSDEITRILTQGGFSGFGFDSPAVQASIFLVDGLATPAMASADGKVILISTDFWHRAGQRDPKAQYNVLVHELGEAVGRSRPEDVRRVLTRAASDRNSSYMKAVQENDAWIKEGKTPEEQDLRRWHYYLRENVQDPDGNKPLTQLIREHLRETARRVIVEGKLRMRNKTAIRNDIQELTGKALEEYRDPELTELLDRNLRFKDFWDQARIILIGTRLTPQEYQLLLGPVLMTMVQRNKIFAGQFVDFFFDEIVLNSEVGAVAYGYSSSVVGMIFVLYPDLIQSHLAKMRKGFLKETRGAAYQGLACPLLASIMAKPSREIKTYTVAFFKDTLEDSLASAVALLTSLEMIQNIGASVLEVIEPSFLDALGGVFKRRDLGEDARAREVFKSAADLIIYIARLKKGNFQAKARTIFSEALSDAESNPWVDVVILEKLRESFGESQFRLASASAPAAIEKALNRAVHGYAQTADESWKSFYRTLSFFCMNTMMILHNGYPDLRSDIEEIFLRVHSEGSKIPSIFSDYAGLGAITLGKIPPNFNQDLTWTEEFMKMERESLLIPLFFLEKLITGFAGSPHSSALPDPVAQRMLRALESIAFAQGADALLLTTAQGLKDLLIRMKPHLAQEIPRGGNILLTPEGEISNEKIEMVNSQVRAWKLDEVITFTVGEMKGRRTEDLGGRMGVFLASETYLSLDQETRTAFEETRLVIRKGQVEVARDENGASYGHYGEDRGPTQFAGEELLNGLLANEELLARWIKIEMSRKIYRSREGRKDARSTAQVIQDLGLEKGQVDRLVNAIIEIQVRHDIQKIEKSVGKSDIAGVITRLAERLAGAENANLEIAGVDLGHWKGEYLSVAIEQLAQKLRGLEKSQRASTGNQEAQMKTYLLSLELKNDDKAMGLSAAEAVKKQIQRKPNSVLLLPTGNTPKGMYRHLVRMAQDGEIDFRQVTIFMLDEYQGGRDYHDFIYKNLISVLPESNRPKIVHVLNGLAENPTQEAEGYERKIQDAGGVDLAVLGIGVEGHIGFNEAGSSRDSRTRLVPLAASTVHTNDEAQRNGYTHALTVGVATILDSRKIILLASGETKAAIINKVWNTEPTEKIPATWLKLHSNATLLVDQKAGALMGSPALLEVVSFHAEQGRVLYDPGRSEKLFGIAA